jgi:hypothetical protein
MSNMIIENPELIQELMVKMDSFANVFTKMMQDRAIAVEQTLKKLSDIEAGCAQSQKKLENELRQLESSSASGEESQEERNEKFNESIRLKEEIDKAKTEAAYCRKFQSDLQHMTNSNSKIVNLERKLEEHFTRFPKGINTLSNFYQIMCAYLQFGVEHGPIMDKSVGENKVFGKDIGNFERQKVSDVFGDVKIFKLPDNQPMNNYHLNKFESEAKQAGKDIFIQIRQTDVSFMKSNNYEIKQNKNQLVAYKTFQ